MAIDMKKYEVSPDKLCWRCDPSIFEFECTGDLSPLGEFIGQDRAIRAIEFGLSMQRQGYNIYVAGLAGTGKTTVVKSYIKKLIEKRKAEDAHLEDWCYLYDISDPDHPQMLNLPQGKGKVFRDHIANLQQALKEGLTKAFSSEEYKSQRKKTVEANTVEQQKFFQQLEEEARQQSFMLQMTPVGPALIAVHNGKPLSDADFMALKESDQKKLEARRDELVKKLQATVEKARELAAKTADTLHKTDKAVADYTVSRLFKSLLEEYKDSPRIMQYLNDLKNYTLNNLDAFKESEEAQAATVMGMPAAYLTRGRDPFLPFQVNVFVDNSATVGPPVIIETNPNYSNLFGKTE
ncbi:MAG: ATP-binding protein, partial [Dehalococcoidales bacterium]|nr:ATP-binding protein [Dehalococcoidales bacterium]